jgi:hypothetical protein
MMVWDIGLSVLQALITHMRAMRRLFVPERMAIQEPPRIMPFPLNFSNRSFTLFWRSGSRLAKKMKGDRDGEISTT